MGCKVLHTAVCSVIIVILVQEATASDDCQTQTITTGYEHACAILSGGVKCWGSTLNEDIDSTFVPVLGFSVEENATIGDSADEMGYDLPWIDLGNVSSPVQISSFGRHTCVRFVNGGVKCWGANDYGQLGLGDSLNRGYGNGDMGNSLPFVNLGTGNSARSICTGFHHTCAVLDQSYDVKCWGRNNYGQLGLGNAKETIGTIPEDMGKNLSNADTGILENIDDLTCGGDITCVIQGGLLKCWGRNTHETLVQESSLSIGLSQDEMGTNLPFFSFNDLDVDEVSVGNNIICVVLRSQNLRCWGSNEYGQAGMGTSNSTISSREITDTYSNIFSDTKSVQCGWDHCCAQNTDKQIKCWGSNFYGELGQQHTRNIGELESELGDALPMINIGTDLESLSFSLGFSYTCIVVENSYNIKCWGINNKGQLGLGNNRGGIGGSFESMGDNLVYTNVSSFNAKGYLNCSSSICAAGKTSNVNFRDCEDCAVGTFSNSGSECQTCPSKSFSTKGSSECTVCEDGYTSRSGEAICFDCPKLQYGLNGTCYPCESGKYSSHIHSTTCELCPPGRFKVFSEASECFPCEAGRVSAEYGRVLPCGSCPQGTWSPEGSSICFNCSTGTYSTETGASTPDVCEACPEGTFCTPGSSSWYVLPNYWRNITHEFNITQCIPPEACAYAGDGTTVCEDGYEGERCGQCVSGEYYKSGNYCKKCGPRVLGWIFLFILLAAFSVFSIWLFGLSELHPTADALLVSLPNIQIIAGFSFMTFDWPSKLSSFLTVISSFNLNPDLFQLDCPIRISYWNKWSLIMLSPLFLGMIFFASGGAMIIFLKYPNDLEVRKQLARAFVFVMLSLYTTLTMTSVQPLICVTDDTGIEVMRYNPVQSCSSDTYILDRSIVLPFTTIYYFGVPLFLIGIFYKFRDEFQKDSIRRQLPILVKRYRMDYFFWESVIILKRLGLVIISGYFDTPEINAYLGLLWLCLYCILLDYFRPRVSRFGDFLDFTWTVLQCLVLTSLFFRGSRDSTESRVVSDFSIILIILLFLACFKDLILTKFPLKKAAGLSVGIFVMIVVVVPLLPSSS